MEIVLNPFIGTIFNLFLISALVITMYTLNFYYLVLLSSRRIANMGCGIKSASNMICL